MVENHCIRVTKDVTEAQDQTTSNLTSFSLPDYQGEERREGFRGQLGHAPLPAG